MGWIAFCLAKTWGPDFFVRLVNHIPGMNSAAFYRYMSPSLSMAVVVLAGLAIDDMVRGRVSKRRLAVGAAAMSGLLVIAALVARNPVQDAPGARHYLVLSFVWGLVVTGAILVVALVFRGGRLAVGVCAVLLVDVVVMFGLPTLSAPRAVATDTRSVAWLQANAGVQRFFTYGPIAAELRLVLRCRVGCRQQRSDTPALVRLAQGASRTSHGPDQLAVPRRRAGIGDGESRCAAFAGRVVRGDRGPLRGGRSAEECADPRASRQRRRCLLPLGCTPVLRYQAGPVSRRASRSRRSTGHL